jgi:L-malate glycosyltransferase
MDQPSAKARDAFDCPPVLLVTPWYGRNGVGLVAEGIAQSIRELGGTCVVLHVVGDGWLPRRKRGREGELIISICARAPDPDASRLTRAAAQLRHLVATALVRYLVRRFTLRVAHFHYDKPEYPALQAICREAGLRCLATFHGSDLSVNMVDKPTKDAAARRLSGCAVITTVSRALQCTLIDLFPDVASRARTIHNAVPADFMKAARTAHVTYRKIDVLFVGDLIPRKGVDVLIHAIRHIWEQHPSLNVVVAGDGAQRQALIDLAGKLGLSDVITFVGRKDRQQVMSLYNQARILAVPSRAEPFGLVVVEGQVCGAVVIASAVGGIPEILADGKTGFLVQPDDARALGAAIVRVLGDELMSLAVVTAARESALTDFSPTRMVLNYRDAYLAATDSVAK